MTSGGTAELLLKSMSGGGSALYVCIDIAVGIRLAECTRMKSTMIPALLAPISMRLAYGFPAPGILLYSLVLLYAVKQGMQGNASPVLYLLWYKPLRDVVCGLLHVRYQSEGDKISAPSGCLRPDTPATTGIHRSFQSPQKHPWQRSGFMHLKFAPPKMEAISYSMQRTFIDVRSTCKRSARTFWARLLTTSRFGGARIPLFGVLTAREGAHTISFHPPPSPPLLPNPRSPMSTNVTLNITLMDGVTAIFLLAVGGGGACKLAVAAMRGTWRRTAELDVEAVGMETGVAGGSVALDDTSVGDASDVDV